MSPTDHAICNNRREQRLDRAEQRNRERWSDELLCVLERDV
jgi:hypothetical protein